MKTQICIFLFLLIPQSSQSQITESQAKALLFSRITSLSEHEGIYNVKTATVRSTVCKIESEFSINERILIIKNGDQLQVTSITNKEEIGKIILQYNSGYDGELKTTGFSKYPNMKVRGCFWEAEIGPRESYHYFAHTSVTSEINRINNYCNWPDWSADGETEKWVSSTRITYRLEKLFPNKFEPPPSLISSGSGVIISKQGHIITNRHVVEKSEYIFEQWPDRWTLKTNFFDSRPHANISTNIKAVIKGIEYELAPVVIFENPSGGIYEIEEDLIILKIINPPVDIKFAITDIAQIGLGDEVYTLGYPLSTSLGASLIYSNGYFSSNTGGTDIYNMSINPGNSGGGIFSKTTGNLIGIATARINDNSIGIKTEGICFGTRLNEICKKIKENNTGFVDLKKGQDKMNKPIWDTNYSSFYDKLKFSFLVRDSKYKPTVTVDNNRQATVQIIAN